MITIYGASDDLVEVEGDIREEFNPEGDGPDYLAFSDGTVLSIRYDHDGIWRISPVHRGGAVLNITQAVVDDPDEYSDRATLEGEIAWVIFGSAMARA